MLRRDANVFECILYACHGKTNRHEGEHPSYATFAFRNKATELSVVPLNPRRTSLRTLPPGSLSLFRPLSQLTKFQRSYTIPERRGANVESQTHVNCRARVLCQIEFQGLRDRETRRRRRRRWMLVRNERSSLGPPFSLPLPPAIPELSEVSNLQNVPSDVAGISRENSVSR